MYLPFIFFSRLLMVLEILFNLIPKFRIRKIINRNTRKRLGTNNRLQMSFLRLGSLGHQPQQKRLGGGVLE
jgi:hypothetical protein